MPTDKGTYHSYLALYEPLFDGFRRSATEVLEIGIDDGSSINIWVNWFPAATITGVDINKTASDSPRVRCIHGSVCDPNIVSQLADRQYDLIIDDGSHVLMEQMAALKYLAPLLKPNALYIIEDIQGWNPQIAELFRLAASFCSLNLIILDRRGIKGTPDDILLVFQR